MTIWAVDQADPSECMPCSRPSIYRDVEGNDSLLHARDLYRDWSEESHITSDSGEIRKLMMSTQLRLCQGMWSYVGHHWASITHLRPANVKLRKDYHFPPTSSYAGVIQWMGWGPLHNSKKAHFITTKMKGTFDLLVDDTFHCKWYRTCSESQTKHFLS
jgi:hypothetical protein